MEHRRSKQIVCVYIYIYILCDLEHLGVPLGPAVSNWRRRTSISEEEKGLCAAPCRGHGGWTSWISRANTHLWTIRLKKTGGLAPRQFRPSNGIKFWEASVHVLWSLNLKISQGQVQFCFVLFATSPQRSTFMSSKNALFDNARSATEAWPLHFLTHWNPEAFNFSTSLLTPDPEPPTRRERLNVWYHRPKARPHNCGSKTFEPSTLGPGNFSKRQRSTLCSSLFFQWFKWFFVDSWQRLQVLLRHEKRLFNGWSNWVKLRNFSSPGDSLKDTTQRFRFSFFWGETPPVVFDGV